MHHGQGERDPAVGRWLAHLAALGVGEVPPPGPRPPRALMAELLDEVWRFRLTAVLVAAVDHGHLSLDDDEVARVREMGAAAQNHALFIEALIPQVMSLMARAGIDARLLKGPSIGQTLYPDPAMRLFGDIDVLVRATHFDAATAALAEAGFHRPMPEIGTGWDREFGKTAMHLDPLGRQLDVHRTLLKGPFGLWIDLDDLFAGDRTIAVAGQEVPILARTPQLLCIAYHAALGDIPPKWVPLRDVAHGLRDPDLDVDDVLRMVGRWRGQAVLKRAIDLAVQRIGMPTSHPLAAWSRTVRIPPLERGLLAVNSAERRTYTHVALSSLPAMAGWRARGRFLRTLVAPSDTFLQDRARSRAQWLAGMRRRDVAGRSGGDR